MHWYTLMFIAQCLDLFSQLRIFWEKGIFTFIHTHILYLAETIKKYHHHWGIRFTSSAENRDPQKQMDKSGHNCCYFLKLNWFTNPGVRKWCVEEFSFDYIPLSTDVLIFRLSWLSKIILADTSRLVVFTMTSVLTHV